MSNNLRIFGCPGAASVAESINRALGNDHVAKAVRTDFSAGEFKFTLPESVRGSHCWVIQVFNRGINDNIVLQFIEALVMLRTLKDCHAGNINLVMPYLPFTRQEKQWARESLNFPMVADLLVQLGVENTITFDLHASATAGLFREKCTHIYSSRDMIPAIKAKYGQFDVVCSADTGSAKMAEFFAKKLECHPAVLYKSSERSTQGRKIAGHELGGDVSGKKVLVVDELCDSGGTLVSAVDYLIDQKGAKEVIVAIVHTLGSGDCRNKLATLCSRPEVKGYITTNSILQPTGFYQGIPGIEIVSLENTIAETIKGIHEGHSVGGVYLTH